MVDMGSREAKFLTDTGLRSCALVQLTSNLPTVLCLEPLLGAVCQSKPAHKDMTPHRR